MVQASTPNVGACPKSLNTKSDAPESHWLDYEARTWNDVFWLLLFVVHIIFMVFLAGMLSSS